MTTSTLNDFASSRTRTFKPSTDGVGPRTFGGRCSILPRKVMGSFLVIVCAATLGAVAQDGRVLGAVTGAVGADHWFLADAVPSRASGHAE